jgi:hypothetical protein
MKKTRWPAVKKALWPASYRVEPSIAKDDVVKAIKDMIWGDQQEWQALRVAANLDDPRSETPESYVAFLKRSSSGRPRTFYFGNSS